MVDILGNVNSLLGGGSRLSPLFNLGMGLLSASGPARMSRGQRIAGALQFATDRQSSLLRNQIAREKLMQGLRAEKRQKEIEARRQQAFGQLQERLGSGQEIGQAELLGMLGGFPAGQDALLKILVSQATQREKQDRGTAQIRNLKFMMENNLIDLKTTKGQEKARQMLTGGAAVNEQLLKGIQLQIDQMKLEQIRREQKEKETTAAKKRRGLEVSTITDIRKLRELSRLNETLRGTIGETGTGFEGMARMLQGLIANTPANVAQTFGISQEKARRLATTIDRFKKLTADLSIESLDRFKNTGALSNQRFATLAASLPSISASPGANKLVIADLLQAIIDSAQVEGVQVPDRQGVVRLIQQLRRGPNAQTAPPPQGQPNIPEGTTATNPQTGERLIFRNNRWERLQ